MMKNNHKRNYILKCIVRLKQDLKLKMFDNKKNTNSKKFTWKDNDNRETLDREFKLVCVMCTAGWEIWTFV